MTQEIPLSEHSTEEIESTLIHISVLLLLTSLLLDTKVPVHTMLECSTVHTFHYKWFVRSVKILSNQRLGLRPDMVLSTTHLLDQIKVVQLLSLVLSQPELTYITELLM